MRPIRSKPSLFRVAPWLALWGAVAASGCRRPPVQPRQVALQVSGHQRFDGAVKLVTNAAGSQPVRAHLREWTIGGHAKLAVLELPFDGTVLVQLRAGRLTTTIDNQRQPRHEGELWVVQAGHPMSIETDDDMALLETTVIAEK